MFRMRLLSGIVFVLLFLLFSKEVQALESESLYPKLISSDNADHHLNTITNIMLDDDNFDTLIDSEPDSTWLILFKTAWCTHCHAMMPAWNALTRTFRKTDHSYRMAIVDGDKAPRLARRFSVEGYPSVFRLFQNQFLEFSPDAARTTRNLLKFATATSDQLDTLEESGILFSSTLQSLKPQPSTQDVLEYHFFRSIQDLQFMYASRPDLVLVLLCFGFLFGVILASFGFYCCIDRNASQVVQKYVRPFENQKKTQEEKQEQARVVQEEDKQQQPAFSQEKTANDFMKSSSPAVDNSEDFKDKMMKKAAKQD